MDGWGFGCCVRNNLSWTGRLVVVILLAICLPINCRPVTSPSGSATLDESSPHQDEPVFFDSQRNTDSDRFKFQPSSNSTGMIVRVIVTSSSSSSSSDSDDSEFSSFHDFQFPHQTPQTQKPVEASSTVKPTTTTDYPEYSELEKSSNSDQNTSREQVEDIFSAFYRAFSHSSSGFTLRGSPNRRSNSPISQNVERFPEFPPLSSITRKTRVSEVGNGNGNNFHEEITREISEDTEPPLDTSSSDTSLVSSSVAVSHHTSSKSVRTPVPRSRKVSLSTSKSSSVSIGVGSGIASNSKIRVTKPVGLKRPGGIVPHYSNGGSAPSISSRTFSNSWDTLNNQKQHQDNSDDDSLSISQPQEAQPIIQDISSTTEIPTSSSPASWQQPEKVWSEPAKVWSLPAQVWSEPAKVWGEPAKNWGQPEKVWGQPERTWAQKSSEQQTEQSTPPPPVSSNSNIRRSIYDPKAELSDEKIIQADQNPDSSEEFTSQEDEDYQRDSDQPEGVESTQGTFVILGDDENEQDSIDGEFDSHLVLPVSTSTTQKPTHTPYTNRNNSHSLRNSKNSSSTDTTTTNRSSGNDSNSQLANSSNNSKKGKKFGYVLDGSNVRRYRVEERTPDGFIVGEYGVLNNQKFIRGVRYTADGTINPRLIHEALMKFLSLRRR